MNIEMCIGATLIVSPLNGEGIIEAEVIQESPLIVCIENNPNSPLFRLNENDFLINHDASREYQESLLSVLD